jgi:putative sigma-54 modulation protein
MKVEFTARQVKINKGLRDLAQEGMDRIGRILGRTAHASVVFGAQRHIQIAEITIQSRLNTIVATGKADDHDAALRQAIAHAEHQARRHRERKLDNKRLPKEEKVLSIAPVARPKAARSPEPAAEIGNGRLAKASSRAQAAIAVHSFPARKAVVEPHVVNNGEAFAIRPMTIEEAVKDAEFRDRDLLIFRTAAGDTFVLHRRRDGQMELVEIP